MKKQIFTLIIFVFSASALWSQDTIRGFVRCNDGLIKWQHEFTTTDSINQLFNYLIESRKVTEYTIIGKHFSGALPQLQANYKMAGYKKGNTPNFVMAYDYTANVLVQFKPGKYRVTLSHIRLINNGSNFNFTNPYNAIENFATNSKGISSSFAKAPATILDVTFVNYFTVSSLISDVW